MPLWTLFLHLYFVASLLTLVYISIVHRFSANTSIGSWALQPLFPINCIRDSRSNMGLFTKKQEQGGKPASGTPSSSVGSKIFGFGRSKPSSVAEELPPPPSPWAPESSSAQRSAVNSAFTSRRNSSTSMRSSMLKELKYEAMVNHLFQQQCRKLDRVVFQCGACAHTSF